MTTDSRASDPVPERRKLQRLRSREGFVTSTAGEFELVNLSPTGISIRGRGVAALTSGAQHVFVVTDRGQTFEVTGEVKWKRPDSDGLGQGRAGVAFIQILHAEPQGLWAGVCRDYSS